MNITDIFLTIINTILSWLLAIFPESTGFSNEFTSLAPDFSAYFKLFETLLPLPYIITLILIFLGIEIVIMIYRFTRNIIKLLPFIN